MFKLIIALLCTYFSDLSWVMMNKIALKGSPVFVPIVNENSLDIPFPHITSKYESWYISAINKQYVFSIAQSNKLRIKYS